MSSRHDKAPFPSTRGLNPDLRFVRVMAARAADYRSTTVRRAILLGHWDGGSKLALFGLPTVYDESWKNRPCEALQT